MRSNKETEAVTVLYQLQFSQGNTHFSSYPLSLTAACRNWVICNASSELSNIMNWHDFIMLDDTCTKQINTNVKEKTKQNKKHTRAGDSEHTFDNIIKVRLERQWLETPKVDFFSSSSMCNVSNVWSVWTIKWYCIAWSEGSGPWKMMYNFLQAVTSQSCCSHWDHQM